MKENLLNWEQSEGILNEELVLDYEEYQDFNEKQNNIYQELFLEKVLKNDSIKFY